MNQPVTDVAERCVAITVPYSDGTRLIAEFMATGHVSRIIVKLSDDVKVVDGFVVPVDDQAMLRLHFQISVQN